MDKDFLKNYRENGFSLFLVIIVVNKDTTIYKKQFPIIGLKVAILINIMII
ncbi:hypothetical protein SCA04_10060 [Staphylococcus carnosus]|nr:hypothetical protein SCA04_10060 [Staphylococcus carnosus]